ncbi:MAG TPA: sugar ABC transporter permease, partial [Clostridiales bacterium]|nr:sugar ABC transporter permease [Clostridiales bacterium]
MAKSRTSSTGTTVVYREPKMPWKIDFQRNWVLYALFIPVALYFILFNYIPMVGIAIAFQDFKIARGIFGSE